SRPATHLHLHSFPTRRSSDLVGEDRLRIEADGLEQNRDRHLATAIHPEIENVLRIEFEIEPGAAIRNDARGEQQLARAVRLALRSEEHTSELQSREISYAVFC